MQVPGINPDIVKQFAPKAGRRPLLPPLSNKAQVALMCRMLFREGWNEHIAGHITYRLDNGNILTNPWELAWDEVTASDILTLDDSGAIIEGEWNTTPALGLHLQLHQLRPEVNVVIHNHARWSGIWANMHRVPPVYDQAGAYVDGPLPLYNEYEGTLEDEDTSLAAAKALGDAKWALLANHGSLVVGAICARRTCARLRWNGAACAPMKWSRWAVGCRLLRSRWQRLHCPMPMVFPFCGRPWPGANCVKTRLSWIERGARNGTASQRTGKCRGRGQRF